MKDITSRIIEYEGGGMLFIDVIELFSDLIKTGLVWSLQGSYGRMAMKFIEMKILDEQGNINQNVIDKLTDLP